MEEFLVKLAEVLKKHGLSEEDILSVKSELSEKPEEESKEEPAEEKEPEAPSEESSVAEGEEKVEESAESEPVESEPSEEEKPAEETPSEEPVAEEEPETAESPMEPEAEPVEEMPVEPEQPSEPESPLPEGVSEVNPEEPVVAPEPAGVSMAEFEKVLSRLDESEKAKEGLEARIESLEQALKQAGVISENSHPSNPVGIDDSTRVADFHTDETATDDVVAELNRQRY